MIDNTQPTVTLRDAAIATGQFDRYTAWQAERNAVLAEMAEMERQWAIEKAARTTQRNRFIIAAAIAAIVFAAIVLAMVLL